MAVISMLRGTFRSEGLKLLAVGHTDRQNVQEPV
jgi:hypothetical protein